MTLNNNYSQLLRNGMLSGTIKRATALHKSRVRARQTTYTTPPEFITIPLGRNDDQTVTAWARQENGRIQNWIDAEAASDCGAHSTFHRRTRWIDDQDCGRYSRRCKYTRYQYAPTMLSRGRATAGIFVANIDGKRYRYTAPKGWKYGTDSLGIYIRRTGETRTNYRYHMDSDDVRGGLAAMRRAGIDHEAKQRTIARGAPWTSRTQKMIDTVGVWVSLADSAAAGNCRGGTRTWCQQHDIDHRRHVRAAVLKRLVGTHFSVQRVIDTATARTAADIRRGYCVI
jgi:hypothetical protein